MTKPEQIIECENKLLEAMQNNNAQIIEELLHDDMLFTIPTGQTVTKAMDIENLRSGVMKINQIKASNQTISLIDDTAIVVVSINLKGRYADNLIDANFRYLRVWKLCNNSWKVIAGSGFQI